ncbi:hypothetical protein P8C59_002844 [Phyllachora maydis]|uniref:Uncharacterized protein n=1 Tax=Phyllachora maydis TaxID=1825666 RepID=A0AAD9I0J0_9PEZI|nr:hypothetical protein P8C59_002844 [Phyllachora maydis]
MLESQFPRRRPAAALYDASADQQPVYGHSRTRTASSNVFTTAASTTAAAAAPAGQHYYNHNNNNNNNNNNQQQPHHHHHLQMQMLVQPQGSHQRRSPSVNTFSTVSSASGSNMAAPPGAGFRTSPSIDVRRSTSSRSDGSPQQQASSYVALLRKQKATVWCDRAQYQDPRLAASQRAAKMRANLEVVGNATSGLGLGGSGSGSGSGSARTSTGLSSAGGKVAAKIRHHGKPGVIGYSPGDNYVGVGGVPLRLSATEVEGEDSEEDEAALQRMHHRRTGSSGRSSTASGRRGLAYRSSGGLGLSNAQGGSRRWSPGDTPERAGSLVEKSGEEMEDSASGKARSFASGSSGEKFDSVPDLSNAARLASKSLAHSNLTREKSSRKPEDLRRRGSVDDRAMTLTTGRLFIANPD